MLSYETFIENLGSNPRYQNFQLLYNPFPPIPIFSFYEVTSPLSSITIFPDELEIIKKFLYKAAQMQKSSIIFIEGTSGVGKSHFLGQIATIYQHDARLFPIFCQIYTGGGFSDITDRALQWLGLEGYTKLILSFLEAAGISALEIFNSHPYVVFNMLIPTFQQVFGLHDRKVLEKILRPFLNLDTGYSDLFKTSHKYKNLILVTLIHLIWRSLDKKTLLIIDNLENRWPYFTSLNKEYFLTNLRAFIRSTRGKAIVLMSDNGLVGHYIEHRLKDHMAEKIFIEHVKLPRLNVENAVKLVSELLRGARDENSKVHELYPFNEEILEYLYIISEQNTRDFLLLCHDVIEELVRLGSTIITINTIRELL
jgi:hypothetical protein